MRRKTRIREGGLFAHPFTYLNASDVAAVPTTIRYRVDCLTTGRKMRDWTTVSAAQDITVTLTKDDNAIVDQGDEFEEREVTVQYNAGLSTQQIQRHRWVVENIHGVA